LQTIKEPLKSDSFKMGSVDIVLPSRDSARIAIAKKHILVSFGHVSIVFHDTKRAHAPTLSWID